MIRRAITAYADAHATKILADTRRAMEHIGKHPEWDDDPADFFQG